MKKKILITDTAPLYPPRWGGPKRIWNLYSNLSQELFDITYVGVNFGLNNGMRYSFNKIRNDLKEILCTVPLHYYFWHGFEKAIFKNTSLDLFIYLWMHTDWHFKYILNSQNADIIICSHPWSSLCINKNSHQFFIYDAHNCEYLLMEQILDKHILKSFVLRQVEKIEGDACKKSDLIFVCSENEKKDFMHLYRLSEDKFCIVPNGTWIRSMVCLEEKNKAKEKMGIEREKIILFIGAYYKPNIEAVEFILKNLALELKEYLFFIVGTVKDAFNNYVLPKNVRFFGMISESDLEIILMASDLGINPMFNGSGVNIKVLDYLGHGLPVVASACGSRGVAVKNRINMLISSFEDFSENIRMVFNDAALFEKLRTEGYKLAKEEYNWESISKKLEEKIKAVKK